MSETYHQWRARMDRAGVPDRYRDKTLEPVCTCAPDRWGMTHAPDCVFAVDEQSDDYRRGMLAGIRNRDVATEHWRDEASRYREALEEIAWGPSRGGDWCRFRAREALSTTEVER